MEWCGSAALEKRNRWIGSLVVWLLTDAFPPFVWSAEKFNFGGPGPVGGVGCGLRCADDDSFLREAQSERPPHPFLPLFRPISRPSNSYSTPLLSFLLPTLFHTTATWSSFRPDTTPFRSSAAD